MIFLNDLVHFLMILFNWFFLFFILLFIVAAKYLLDEMKEQEVIYSLIELVYQRIMTQCLSFLTQILPAYVAWVILMFCKYEKRTDE